MAPAELTVVVLLAWSLPDSEREALLGACTRAFARGTCVATSEVGDAALSASVRQENGDEISLEVRVRGGEERTRRILQFGEADSEIERAKAVGLTVGVLAGELLHRRAEAPQPEAGPEPARVAGDAGARAHRDGAGSRRHDVFVGAQLGVGWESGLRVAEPGVALRAGVRFGGTWMGVALDENWLEPAGSDLRVRKGHAALWAGVSRPWGAFELGGAVELGAQWLRADTLAPLAADQEDRLIPVVRLNAMASYWAGDWGVAVTARAAWLSSSTSLFVRDEVVAETSRLGLAALIGPVFRWRAFGE